MVAVRTVRTDKIAFFFLFACRFAPRTGTINAVVPNPYRTDCLMLQATSKFVPLLCLEIREQQKDPKETSSLA
jgi:hypothetical protein